ncbi:MAG: cytochrome C assembly family protein [Pseudomonadota bacterium]
MPSGAFYVVAHFVVAALYLLLALRAWRSLQGEVTGPAPADWSAFALPVIALLHAALLATAIFGDSMFRFGFAQALSATLLLAVLIVWAEGFFVPMRGLQLFVLPLAALSAVLPAVFHGAPVAAASDTPALRVHLLVAISAYSLLTIAAMHGLLMASMDRHLHGSVGDRGGTFGRILREMPPLLAMERMLFRLIAIGFVLLTATVVSGVFFTELLFGRPLRFDHKTVFTIASWLVFAGLLAGRFVFGWRGRTALRWTLAGFLMLLLAYVGSRFVLEVILQRV